MSPHAHHAGDRESVTCAVLTVSDTRTVETDSSGACIRDLLHDAGHRVAHYAIHSDEPEQILAAMAALPHDVQVVLLSGGTGIAPRDTTYEAIVSLIDKPLQGFGELFRMLSYEQIGAAAMLSRAVAGVAGTRVLFSMPGSRAAVELAMTKLILPQIGHVAALLGQRP